MAKLKKLEPKPREAKYRLTLTRKEARHIQALVGRCGGRNRPLRGVWDALFAEFGWDLPSFADSDGSAIPTIHFNED